MTPRFSESHVIASVGRLTRTRLRAFVASGCVTPAEQEGEPVFGEADLARLELLCELAEDFELDEDALALVMSLIDQLHGLRRELRGLVRAIEQEPPEVRARIRDAYSSAKER